MIETAKFQITEYVSYEKQLLLDAKKYVERAEMYFAIGKFKHCTGCLVKASKKIEIAEAHKLSMDGLGVALMTPIMKRISEHIIKGILEG